MGGFYGRNVRVKPNLYYRMMPLESQIFCPKTSRCLIVCEFMPSLTLLHVMFGATCFTAAAVHLLLDVMFYFTKRRESFLSGMVTTCQLTTACGGRKIQKGGPPQMTLDTLQRFTLMFFSNNFQNNHGNVPPQCHPP